jgi:hypothetical protein
MLYVFSTNRVKLVTCTPPAMHEEFVIVWMEGVLITEVAMHEEFVIVFYCV